MLKIRTKPIGSNERADIICEQMSNLGKTVMLEDVEEIKGSVRILRYHHGTQLPNIEILIDDIVYIKTA